MKLKEIDFRIWNPSLKMYGMLEGEINVNGKLNKKIDVAIIPLTQEGEFELCVGVDRKGSKVYEGDIVKYCNESDWLCKVEIKRSNLFRVNLIDLQTNEKEAEFCGELCEVIGNIHENPELLKEKE